jgi:hypothetical protein
MIQLHKVESARNGFCFRKIVDLSGTRDITNRWQKYFFKNWEIESGIYKPLENNKEKAPRSRKNGAGKPFLSPPPSLSRKSPRFSVTF